MIALYLRVTYDYDYDEAHNHPIIEIVKDPLATSDLWEIKVHLDSMFKEEFLKKATVRFLKK